MKLKGKWFLPTEVELLIKGEVFSQKLKKAVLTSFSRIPENQ